MKSRLGTRYFLIFGGLAALSALAVGLLLFFFNVQALEDARLNTYRQASESLAAVSDAVLRGREDAGVMRTALSITETTLLARVFVIADHAPPFTSAAQEPLLSGAAREFDALNGAVYMRGYRYEGVAYALYASPLPNMDGAVVIVDSAAGIAGSAGETGFLMALAVLGTALIVLLLTGVAASRQAAPIIALKTAAEKLRAGEDPDSISASGQNDELGTLIGVFDSMKAAFATEARARDDFTANISHDLRTPLTSIHGFTQGMLDGVIKPEEYRKTLEIISREAKHMIRLTGDILEVARIDSGRLKLNKEYVDLPELLHEILEGLAGSYEDVRRALTFEGSIGVMADRARLLQVFTNLLVNAFKYNKPAGEVTIEVSRKAKTAEITISDTGIGMSEDELSHIFEKFYRADKSRTASNEGTGIGMYVVKRLLEMHNANIVYTSSPGEGTVVRVELPL